MLAAREEMRNPEEMSCRHVNEHAVQRKTSWASSELIPLKTVGALIFMAVTEIILSCQDDLNCIK